MGKQIAVIGAGKGGTAIAGDLTPAGLSAAPLTEYVRTGRRPAVAQP